MNPSSSTAKPPAAALGAAAVRHAATVCELPSKAAEELGRALQPANGSMRLLGIHGDEKLLRSPEFLSSMQGQYPGVAMIGCSTAGEFSPNGYQEGGAVAWSLEGDGFHVATEFLPGLALRSEAQIHQDAVQVLDRLVSEHPGVRLDRCFAIVLIDGLSGAEERVAYNLQSGLGEIPLVGGSAGDGLKFAETLLMHDGALHTDCAVLAVIESPIPFQLLKHQHVVPTETKLVVTHANPAERLLLELEGMPAAECLAETLGVAVEELQPARFARSPVMLRMGGEWFVRSLRQVDSGGGVFTYCAIDEGLVLTLGRGEGERLAIDLGDALESAAKSLGGVQMVLGFDCILRRLQYMEVQRQSSLADVFRRYHAVGFNTYGEQFGPTHINQTFTGVAFGRG